MTCTDQFFPPNRRDRRLAPELELVAQPAAFVFVAAHLHHVRFGANGGHARRRLRLRVV